MPEICRFYGIVIRMYYEEHNPPHFHAQYATDEALIDIRTLAVFAGKLPPRALGLVMEWAMLHQKDLMHLWHLAKQRRTLHRLEPLA